MTYSCYLLHAPQDVANVLHALGTCAGSSSINQPQVTDTGAGPTDTADLVQQAVPQLLARLCDSAGTASPQVCLLFLQCDLEKQRKPC